MRELDYLTGFYDHYDEEGRLLSPHGQVEFLTTMRYAEKYLSPGSRVLEIGAGTGRYSHTLARMGYPVDAVELVPSNIERFRAATQPGEAVAIRQGDALDLSFSPDNAYDLTLLLGPMYHLYTEEHKLAALSEALRVTKPGGVLCVAYCISDASILQYGFLKGNVHTLIAKGLLNTETFEASSTPAEVFELCRKEDIDALLGRLPNARRLHYVATDLYTNYFRDAVDSMDEETFRLYLRYHFAICEREDMAGISHHVLDVVEKLI